MDEKYYSVAEVAQKFSVSKTLIYRLIRDGIIPAIRIGESTFRIGSRTIEQIKDGGLLISE